MYRFFSKRTNKTPKKHYWGGVVDICPPPPGYASELRYWAAEPLFVNDALIVSPIWSIVQGMQSKRGGAPH